MTATLIFNNVAEVNVTEYILIKEFINSHNKDLGNIKMIATFTVKVLYILDGDFICCK